MPCCIYTSLGERSYVLILKFLYQNIGSFSISQFSYFLFAVIAIGVTSWYLVHLRTVDRFYLKEFKEKFYKLNFFKLIQNSDFN